MDYIKRLLSYDEKLLIKRMIEIYCTKKHRSDGLCNECNELLSYCNLRIEKCKFGEDKPTCVKCTVHCYRKDFREKVREVMRYSGPRVMLYKPIASIKHLIKEKIY